MPKDTFFNLAEDKRDKILDIATTEFENNSYENASVNQIVLKSGISKGSFYQYFEGKKDLYQRGYINIYGFLTCQIHIPMGSRTFREQK